jgi:hypothetical protein
MTKLTASQKIEHQRFSFLNIQELIRFTDQKVAAILVIVGLLITAFMTVLQHFPVFFSTLNSDYALIYFAGIIFITDVIIIFYLSIFNVLKPNLAKHYSKNEFSTLYYEHIAASQKEDLWKSVEDLDARKQLIEISDQIFEISKILLKKIKNTSVIIVLLFFAIILLGIFTFCCWIILT